MDDEAAKQAEIEAIEGVLRKLCAIGLARAEEPITIPVGLYAELVGFTIHYAVEHSALCGEETCTRAIEAQAIAVAGLNLLSEEKLSPANRPTIN